MAKSDKVRQFAPFILTLGVIVADQVSKAWIARQVPQGMMVASFWNDFISIWHVRNSAIGFSIGHNWPQLAKSLLFIIVPLILLLFLTLVLARSALSLEPLLRWALAGLIGGGLGNMIDRIFRAGGVVDFISVRMYGLFGLERWPTFNLADSTIVICGILMLFYILFSHSATKKEKNVNE